MGLENISNNMIYIQYQTEKTIPEQGRDSSNSDVLVPFWFCSIPDLNLCFKNQANKAFLN